VDAVSLFRPRGWDFVPSTSAVGGCARRLLHVTTIGAAAYVCVLVVATTVGAWLHRGPDPGLLRAACASKTSADVGRSLLSMTSIPRGSPIVRQVYEATEAELAAWADSGAVCP